MNIQPRRHLARRAKTSYLVYVRIGEPARKHGITDADILHAARHAIREVPNDDDMAMIIGPARNGEHLEIGILGIDTDDPVIIHADKLRAKFRKFLGHRG
jgi:hypothetical protein